MHTYTLCFYDADMYTHDGTFMFILRILYLTAVYLPFQLLGRQSSFI